MRRQREQVGAAPQRVQRGIVHLAGEVTRRAMPSSSASAASAMRVRRVARRRADDGQPPVEVEQPRQRAQQQRRGPCAAPARRPTAIVHPGRRSRCCAAHRRCPARRRRCARGARRTRRRAARRSPRWSTMTRAKHGSRRRSTARSASRRPRRGRFPARSDDGSARPPAAPPSASARRRTRAAPARRSPAAFRRQRRPGIVAAAMAPRRPASRPASSIDATCAPRRAARRRCAVIGVAAGHRHRTAPARSASSVHQPIGPSNAAQATGLSRISTLIALMPRPAVAIRPSWHASASLPWMCCATNSVVVLMPGERRSVVEVGVVERIEHAPQFGARQPDIDQQLADHRALAARNSASTAKVAPCRRCAGPNSSPRKLCAIMMWSQTVRLNIIPSHR